jgi:hypothetical protein
MHCKTLKVTPFLRREEAVPDYGLRGLGFGGLLAALRFSAPYSLVLLSFLFFRLLIAVPQSLPGQLFTRGFQLLLPAVCLSGVSM